MSAELGGGGVHVYAPDEGALPWRMGDGDGQVYGYLRLPCRVEVNSRLHAELGGRCAEVNAPDEGALTLRMGDGDGQVYGYLRLPCRVEVNSRRRAEPEAANER